MARILFMNSVVEPDGTFYAADEEYDVEDDKADEFVIKGYATGALTRVYTEEEITEIKNSMHKIGGP